MNSNHDDAQSADTEGSDTSGIFDALTSDLAQKVESRHTHRDQQAIWIRHTETHAVLSALKSAHDHVYLTDVTAVDYLDKETPERFCVVYVLQDRSDHRYYRVHAWLPEEDPTTDSVSDLWLLARWGEREAHDMFGIVFDGNPDLRRFLMPEDYPGFPLLKDYPLKGMGERAQFPVTTPEGDQMTVSRRTEYPVTIGRDLHTPEYLKAMQEDSKPRTDGAHPEDASENEGGDRGQ